MRRIAVLSGVIVAGCLGQPLTLPSDTDDDETSATSGETPPSVTSLVTADPPDPPVTSDEGSTVYDDPPWTEDGTSEDEGMTFIDATDATDHGCDVLAQDCPPGQKCAAYAPGGGPLWSATHCVPVAREPVPVGGMCNVLGEAWSGIDDCELGAMCWWIEDDLTGVCVHNCTGTWDAPACPERDAYCQISSEGALALCMPTCDPIAQDCAMEELTCYPNGYGEWGCAPDISGDEGQFGDPCDFINGCDPGLACLDASAFTSCEGIGCCTYACNHTLVGADDFCAQVDPAQSCEPWYPEGEAPAGAEHIGVCTIP